MEVCLLVEGLYQEFKDKFNVARCQALILSHLYFYKVNSIEFIKNKVGDSFEKFRRQLEHPETYIDYLVLNIINYGDERMKFRATLLQVYFLW